MAEGLSLPPLSPRYLSASQFHDNNHDIIVEDPALIAILKDAMITALVASWLATVNEITTSTVSRFAIQKHLQLTTGIQFCDKL
jgi:hypothetical protein